jgi:hypothetical protein
MSKEVSASFQIISDSLSAAELRQRSGLSGGVTHDRVEPLSQGRRHVYKHATLRIDSSLSPASSVGEHLDHLLSRVQSQASNITTLPDDCLCEVWLKISHDQQQLGCEFSPRTIALLAALRTGLNIDTYGSALG